MFLEHEPVVNLTNFNERTTSYFSRVHKGGADQRE